MAQSQTWANMTDNLIMTNSVTSHPPSRVQGGRTGRTEWTYVTLSNGDTVIDPIMGFYRNPPIGAQCSWSTDHGRKSPAFFDKNDWAMPPRELTRWSDEKLASVAAEYSQKYWEDMRQLVRPETFEDLYRYFDSATLWLNGAYNMWNLLNMLVTEAHRKWPAVLADWKNYIDAFVNDYIHNRTGYLYNRVVLGQWDGMKDMLIHARSFHDWPYDDINSTLDLQQQDMVREALISQHMSLGGRQHNTPQYYPWYPRPVANMLSDTVNTPTKAAPQDAVAANPVTMVAPQHVNAVSTNTAPVQPSTCSSASEPVVAVPAAPAVTDRSTAPRASPPPAPLTSIPEELVAIKTDGLVIGIATKTTTEAHTPVPNIVTNDATPPRDNTLRDRKDSNGSIDRLFFNPVTSSGHLQVQGRHLSTSSAPGEESEPMLSGDDMGVKKRMASEAPPTAKSTPFNKPSQKKSKGTPGPGNYHATKNGKQGPERGLRKPTATNGPMPPRNLENAPMYHFAQHFQQQPGLHMGPSAPHSSQQMMPTFGTANGMAPAPPFFISSPPGVQHDPNGNVPRVPAPSSSMTPMGPPMMPFQEQMPNPRPHMGQAPFGYMHGPPMSPMNMHPPSMGSQHQWSSNYQPNGYIPQPEHQVNRGFSGIRDGNQPNHKQGPGNRDNRHNSVNRNASRKIRDDPIHGAIYALGQPRKISNASSDRRPSIANGPHRPNAEHMPLCKNLRLNCPDFASRKFDECPCPRCEEATRSAFVKSRGKVDLSDPVGNLAKHFAKFKPVSIKRNKLDYVVEFQNDLDAIKAIQEARTSSDKSIKGLTTNSIVWYPFYSKHYTGDMNDNVTGLPRHLYEARNRAATLELSRRRDSNPFQGARRPTMDFNDTNVTNGGPGPIQQGFQPALPPPHAPMAQHSFNPGNGISFQPMPSVQSQRQLWVPPASPNRPSTVPSSSIQIEQRNVLTDCPGVTVQRREDILQKEDWRSKPPSEEALTTDGGHVAVTDTASNHSSQGAKSIRVSLPSEGGSAREGVSRPSSRSASPEADGEPQEMLLEQSGDKAKTGAPEKSQGSPTENISKSEPRDITEDDHEKSAASSRTITPEGVKPVETHKKKVTKAGQDTPRKLDEKVSPKKVVEKNAPKIAPEVKVSGYRKITTDLAAPVESLEASTSKSSYRKTTNQLSSAVEQIGYATGTIIRHKPSRSPLPKEWVPDESTSTTAPHAEEPIDSSGIRSRFDEIGAAFAIEELISQSNQARELKPSDATESPTETKQAPRTHQPKKKNSMRKKGKAQADGSHPESRPNTPIDRQPPRGSSPALNRPLSAAAGTASSPNGPLPATENSNGTNYSNRPGEGAGTIKRKKNKSKAKSKPTPQTGSEFLDGQAKGSGSQDNKDLDTRQGSPSKMPRVPQPGPVEETGQPEAPRLVVDSQNKTEKQHDESRCGKYRANNGGSLRMDKNRALAKGDATSLSTIFEPPTKDTKDVSPDANLFPQQKFSIDQARKAGPPPKMSLDVDTQEVGTTKSAGSNNKGLHTFPEIKSISKQPSGDWAAVVKGSFRSGRADDPFSSSKREEIPKEWTMKSTQKAKPQAEDEKIRRDQTSPTPSPEKKSQRSTKSKSKLNATAQSFTLPGTSSLAPKLRLDPKAKEFTTSHPSSPAMSVVSTAGRHGGSTANLKENEPPQPAARSALPKQPVLNDGTSKKSRLGHAKKPSLPGQSNGIEKRFVTPAEQVLNPSKVSQPGPPAKDKKNGGGGPRQGPLPDRTGSNSHVSSITNPRTISASEQSKQMIKTEVVAKTATDSAPSKADDDYPSLGQTAAVERAQKKSSASIVKVVTPLATTTEPTSVAVSDKAATTAAPKGSENQNQIQGQRSVTAPALAVTKTQQLKNEEKHPNDQQPSEKNMWQTVGSAKKNTGGGAAKAPGGRGGRGARWGHGGRGGRAGSTEERKGG